MWSFINPKTLIKPSYSANNWTFEALKNKEFFNKELSLIDWLRQYSKEDQTESFIRGWLGRMLFSGEESLKKCNVLSGGEKVRCMFAKIMLESPNILFSSHDAELLQTVANRVISFNKDGSIIDRMMSYEDFLDSQN